MRRCYCPAVLPVLSEDWFDEARRLTADLPPQPCVNAQVRFQADGVVWHQVIEDGRVTAWALDEPPGREFDLDGRWSLDAVQHLYRGQLDGTQALAALRVANGGRLEMPSPMDIADVPELTALPVVPDATIAIQFFFARGPFGPVSYWWRFEEGRSAGMGLGVVDDPDAAVLIPFQNMVGVRRGDITILEALEGGGRVDGGVGPLMLLAGLFESAPIMAAEAACGPSGPVLARLGLVHALPEFQRAMAALAEVTE